MYHRIIDPEEDHGDFIQPGMFVFKDTFRSQLEYLNNNYRIVSLRELIDRLVSGRDINRYCAITFDDGWLDNYIHAFPMLLQYQAPATLFLATEFIGTQRLFWPEELTFALKNTHVLSSSIKNNLLERLIGSIKIKDRAGDHFYDAAIMALKTWSPQDREELLSQLRAQSNRPFPERRLISWEEARRMQDSGLITFGAHTGNHVILDQIPLHEAEREIVQSRNDIERKLGVIPDYFSYPNGNLTDEIKLLLKKHEFKGAVTTRKGHFGKGCDLLEIPRIAMHQDISSTIPLFQSRILLT
jgi:peptidoglycan/xylan/chitin deacetylase (PgdA/CDA1 family)